MEKETLRMQMLAGVITEGEYKAKLKELNSTENKNSSRYDDLAENIYSSGFSASDTGRPDFHQMTADEIEDYLEKDKDNPSRLFGRSLTLVKSLLKAKREKEKLKESLNEHYIAGGIVGVGAINNPFEGRKKEKYEDAFEYFLNKKYNLKEAEEETMVDSNMLSSYIDELINLADDMEYTPEMVQELESLKTRLSGGKMSVENALDIIQQTIDITEDEIDAVEALGQAVDYDDTIISKAREISGLDEGKEVEEPNNY